MLDLAALKKSLNKVNESKDRGLPRDNARFFFLNFSDIGQGSFPMRLYWPDPVKYPKGFHIAGKVTICGTPDSDRFSFLHPDYCETPLRRCYLTDRIIYQLRAKYGNDISQHLTPPFLKDLYKLQVKVEVQLLCTMEGWFRYRLNEEGKRTGYTNKKNEFVPNLKLVSRSEAPGDDGVDPTGRGPGPHNLVLTMPIDYKYTEDLLTLMKDRPSISEPGNGAYINVVRSGNIVVYNALDPSPATPDMIHSYRNLYDIEKNKKTQLYKEPEDIEKHLRNSWMWDVFLEHELDLRTDKDLRAEGRQDLIVPNWEALKTPATVVSNHSRMAAAPSAEPPNDPPALDLDDEFSGLFQ